MIDVSKANKIAIETSKTGKVTAVDAILKVFGVTPNNSRNSKPGKPLSKPNKWLNLKKNGLNRSSKHHGRFCEPSTNASKRLVFKQTTIRVLLDTGLSGDLLFTAKGSQKYIPTLKRAVPQLWGTSNGTFTTKKVGEITLSIVELIWSLT